jgi:hypothetical protein
MTGIVDWAAARARMVLAFILLSILAGTLSYMGLPKEGEPDIEVPALFITVPFPGISAEDSEKLLVKPMETELSDLDGLKTMTGTAAENFGGVALEFEFGWDKTKTLADVRDAMDTAEAEFPDGFEKYTINEVNFSEFPIIIVNLSGPVPERTMSRLARDLQDTLEGLEPVLEAGIAGNREEMVEVVIDPLRLEAYNVTALERARSRPRRAASRSRSHRPSRKPATSTNCRSRPMATASSRSAIWPRSTSPSRTGSAPRASTARRPWRYRWSNARASTSSTPPIWCARWWPKPRAAGPRNCRSPSTWAPRTTSRARWNRWSRSSKARC